MRFIDLTCSVLAFAWIAVACSAAGEGSADQVGGTSGVGGKNTGGKTGTGGIGGGSGGSSATTCAELAAKSGWFQAFCEWNGNDACQATGTPTTDCDFCCPSPDQGGGGTASGGSGGSGGSTGGSGGTTATTGFGYPVGDKTASPAGGWIVWQILSHYSSGYGGRHLAQDVSSPGGGLNAINAPVYAIADGLVLYAKPNSSQYKNVLLIEHDVGDGTKVCSFFGHINPPLVSAGDKVTRGQKIATVKDWAECATGGASTNTHLHWVLADQALCAAAKSWNSICGYDKGGDNGLPASDLSEEPYYYTAVNDPCGASNYAKGLISPTKFIDDHHF